MSEKPTLEVCLSPKMWNLFDATGKTVVVIDVLRATTTIAFALSKGIEKIIPVETIEECIGYRDKGFYLAAERDGLKPSGFTFGNSPFDYNRDDLSGKTLVLTTTNGTQCIKNAVGADKIITGAFANYSAVVESIGNENKNTILFCAGWKGHFNLEDTLFAGAVVARLQHHFNIIQDAAIAAKILYSNAEEDLMDVIQHTSHYQRLGRFALQDDIAFCLSLDTLDLVPVWDGQALIAAETTE